MTNSLASPMALFCAASTAALLGAFAACSSDEAPPPGAAADAATSDVEIAETGVQDGGVTEAGCDDSVGTSGACDYFLDGGTGKALPNGNAKFCLDKRSCNNLLSSLKPRIAQLAIECLAAIPECTEDLQIQECVVAALETSCPSTGGQAVCDQGFAKCAVDGGDAIGFEAGFTKARCLQWTSGMTGDWLAVFPMCLGTSNGCADPYICVPY